MNRVAATLVHHRFTPEDALRDFSAALDPSAGAIVTFSGIARGRGRDGAVVDWLVLEHHPRLTQASLDAIAADAAARFAVSSIGLIHRAGRIAPGEAIVWVAVAADHRRAAFEAADYLMDRLKTEAYFWKREEGRDGSRWIEPTATDRSDRARWE